jgi:coenzyme F420-dependent glucose-6-phosphate dehydrogenase
MPEIGYALSSEEHSPNDLVRHARLAEEAGFPFALISDHFHPWTDRQGHSPFVWSVIGGIAQVTERLRLGTGVTAPIIRTHPAIIAHAAATAAVMMEGRFFLGVGTGENLNEHVLGGPWPATDRRREMLEEAIEVIRHLWEGGYQSHYGRFYTVENAKIYDLPERPIEIFIAASGEQSAEMAGGIGDGFIGTSPQKDTIKAFDRGGGARKPKYGQLTVCWNESEREARRIAYEIWPTAGIGGQLSQELPLPLHFEQAAENVTEDKVAESVVCGPDPQRHLDKIREYLDAGYTDVYVHQIGPDQEGFIRFYEREILPQFRSEAGSGRATGQSAERVPIGAGTG